MIEFSGIISDEIRKRIIKKRDRFAGFLCLFGAVIGVTISIIMACFNVSFVEILVFSCIPIPIAIFLLISPQFPNSKRFQRFKWDYIIKVDDNNIYYEIPLVNQLNTISISKVKRVIDEGDCYCIVHQEYSNAIVCQKNLLKNGTVDDFEKIFDRKITKK